MQSDLRVGDGPVALIVDDAAQRGKDRSLSGDGCRCKQYNSKEEITHGGKTSGEELAEAQTASQTAEDAARKMPVGKAN